MSEGFDPKIKSRPLKIITDERIARLSEVQRDAWNEYVDRSRQAFAREFDMLANECTRLGISESKPAPSNSKEFEFDSSTPETWFASDEARELCKIVISYQTPTGGWSKAINYEHGTRPQGIHWTSQSSPGWHYCGTLDNRSTTEQIKFLARVYSASQVAEAKEATVRGINWLLDAQFPHGGWPQCYPLEPGYHEAVTLNDNAMLHAMELLHEIMTNKERYSFLDESIRERCQVAFQKALAFVVAAQVKVNGQPTVWCAQHDPLTLAPASARLKEPPALSGSESAELLKFLMREGPITPEIVAVIESGVQWLGSHKILGLKKTKNQAGKTDYVDDATSTEVYWARFYDVQTAKPMFAGAQDGIVYWTFSEMAAKNKVGYDYFSTRPKDVIEKEYPRWKKRIDKENAGSR